MIQYHFQFERRQVARLEMEILLEAFNVDGISSRSLAEYFGTVKIGFSGYTPRDPHPLHDQELRRFLRLLGQRWHPGAAAYFCEFHSPFLWLYLTAQLDHLSICERVGTDNLIVFHRRAELLALQQTSLAGFEQLGRRASLSPSLIAEHKQTLSQLFTGLFRHEWQEK